MEKGEKQKITYTTDEIKEIGKNMDIPIIKLDGFKKIDPDLKRLEEIGTQKSKELICRKKILEVVNDFLKLVNKDLASKKYLLVSANEFDLLYFEVCKISDEYTGNISNVTHPPRYFLVFDEIDHIKNDVYNYEETVKYFVMKNMNVF
jgi:hypothetical protein